jgi:dethiobiotin synthetase
MRPVDEPRLTNPLRIVLVGTGTGIGKTHVACALLAAWSERVGVVGLKPIETGISSAGPTLDDQELGTSGRAGFERFGGAGRRGRDGLGGDHAVARSARGDRGLRRFGRAALGEELSDQERLAMAARTFHVKQKHGQRGAAASARATSTLAQPLRSLYAFPEPVSPHLAARNAGIRIDLGRIERWIAVHEGPVTVIETAGGLFSPLGHGATNFDLLRTLRPHAAILVAPDRLGVLHELTTTLAHAAALGGPAMAVVLSSPAKRDDSTGRNAEELAALGIARPVAVFPRAGAGAPATLEAGRLLVGWLEATLGAAFGTPAR